MKRERKRGKPITSMSKDYSNTYVFLGILIINWKYHKSIKQRIHLSSQSSKFSHTTHYGLSTSFILNSRLAGCCLLLPLLCISRGHKIACQCHERESQLRGQTSKFSSCWACVALCSLVLLTTIKQTTVGWELLTMTSSSPAIYNFKGRFVHEALSSFLIHHYSS